MRLDYAQFLELELFSRFGAVSDPRTRQILEHGRKIRAVLAQEQFAPLSEAAQVALLLALGKGQLDRLTPDEIARFKARLPGLLAQAGGMAPTDDTSRDALLARTGALVAEIAGSKPAAGTGSRA